ncbi:MAG: hypothetical protein GC155_03300 [Alphaproteobacteria bacterium]|nr:hypothetical protein [Alphaproteobacteria bacterium]
MALTAAIAAAQERHPAQTDVSALSSQPLTPFERSLLDHIRTTGLVSQGQSPPSAGHNARGLILKSGSAAVLDLTVTGRKYGISLDATGPVLIRNYRFSHRRSDDPYGSGLILGSKSPTTGPTYLSNARIDLKEAGPNPDYRVANNEAITVERGNKLLNVREATLLGAQESGLDNKGDVVMDAVFIASGHRSVRIWSGASLVLVNSTVLAFPGYHGFWFGSGDGVAHLEYYNCRFGAVGDPPGALTDQLPDWMIDREEGANVQITQLDHDPLDRSADSFWIPVRTPTPAGYLAETR